MTIQEDVSELKSQVAVLERNDEIIEQRLEELKLEGKAREEKLDTLILKMEKYEGKFGGVLLVLGALAAFLKIEWIKVLAFFGIGK